MAYTHIVRGTHIIYVSRLRNGACNLREFSSEKFIHNSNHSKTICKITPATLASRHISHIFALYVYKCLCVCVCARSRQFAIANMYMKNCDFREIASVIYAYTVFLR